MSEAIKPETKNTKMTTETIKTSNTFKGFHATAHFEDGAKVPCYVVNSRNEMQFKDGSVGPAFKVKYGTRYLTASGERYAVRFSTDAFWIKASRINAN